MNTEQAKSFTDMNNELNDFVIQFEQIIKDKGEDFRFQLIYPTKCKLHMIRRCANVCGGDIRTMEDVRQTIMESCIDEKLSFEDTAFEIGKYLCAFIELENTNWEVEYDDEIFTKTK